MQNSVANWLNDASKDNPQWVIELCAQWKTQSDTKETNYIINRALRTLRKSGSYNG
ncbi:DNA alkylation repair protein [Candidatus Magnetoovum chiemensis]|nr:DNA alkylation repair protein [Candidatus Magnetoovum chiemensis]